MSRTVKSLYRRGPGLAPLNDAIPFHQIFAAEHQLAASKLREAAALAEDARRVDDQ